MKTRIPLTVVALAFAGCATPFRAPPELAHLKLVRTDSPVVRVEKIWLDGENGPLAVQGYVLKRLAAGDTTGTHLDVTVYDDASRVLRTTTGQFEPRQILGRHSPEIPGRHRHQNYARYRVTLDPLPAGAARIEVRAHEGPHS